MLMVEKRLHNERGEPLTLFGHPIHIAPDTPQEVKVQSLSLIGEANQAMNEADDAEQTETRMHQVRQGDKE